MVTVGQQLLAPETGWQRIDGADTKIIYGGAGSWLTASHASRYGGNIKYSSVNTISEISHFITFKFKSTKLRILDELAGNRPNQTKIIIDSVEYVYSSYNIASEAYPIFCGLAFEISNLEDREHIVKIYSENVGYLSVDAIDIDDTGYISPIPRL